MKLNMKTTYLIAALIAFTFNQSFAQNAATKPASLLSTYYAVKDALTTGNSVLAASRAEEFTSFLKDSNSATIDEASRSALLKDASQISAKKDLKRQRESFVSFSNTMRALAKKGKLSAEPIYELYCPMKKSYWLSSVKVVKNPYYGASMLTCGSIVGTL